jgi:hypothetical protein
MSLLLMAQPLHTLHQKQTIKLQVKQKTSTSSKKPPFKFIKIYINLSSCQILFSNFLNYEGGFSSKEIWI